MKKIDETDQKILDILCEDARMSYAEIGRHLNLTRVTVRERVAALVESGVIERFSIIINPPKVGYNLSAFFEIGVHPNKLHEVANALADNKFVQSVNQMTGPNTLHVHASLRDSNHLQDFMQNAIYNLSGINNVNSYVLLRGFKVKKGGIKIGN
jgi:DNA-binding Lrp family transcriptional regulator